VFTTVLVVVASDSADALSKTDEEELSAAIESPAIPLAGDDVEGSVGDAATMGEIPVIMYNAATTNAVISNDRDIEITFSYWNQPSAKYTAKSRISMAREQLTSLNSLQT
jgi:hypothetical protein